MSVGLLITSRMTSERRELLPIAPQKIFVSRWMPGCSALQLEWVPLFETGIMVDSANAGPILDDLRRLRGWMSKQDGYGYDLERLFRLIARMTEALMEPDLEIFVG